MTPELALRKHLLTKTEITGDVSRVIVGDIAPEQAPRPHVMIRRSDSPWLHTLDGTGVGTQYGQIHLELRDDDSLRIQRLGTVLVRALLELDSGATITVSGDDVVICELSIIDAGTDEESIPATDDGHTSEIFIRSLVVEIGHEHDISPAT